MWWMSAMIYWKIFLQHQRTRPKLLKYFKIDNGNLILRKRMASLYINDNRYELRWWFKTLLDWIVNIVDICWYFSVLLPVRLIANLIADTAVMYRLVQRLIRKTAQSLRRTGNKQTAWLEFWEVLSQKLPELDKYLLIWSNYPRLSL